MNPPETPAGKGKNHQKPPFRRAIDDSKPFLHDSLSRSDPTETEEAVLRPPTIVIPSKTSMELGGGR
ncbi:hypothetical protein MLD38_007359 [Melastoma candidum]|uniref:Uncharacterized protein n=1 Tax=Melastoma candidum TaxID=119954 RepID=A0ACB9RQC8_9MYRT|nr:hypothetical protein MLD38_007359 [Melastoma candidum]